MKRACLLIIVVVALGSYAFAPRTSAPAVQEPVYGDCKTTGMTLTQICSLYHENAPGLVGVTACLGEECLTKRDGHEITVIAPGKSGEFPTPWHVWLTPRGGKLDSTTYACPTCDQCVLPDKDKKVGTGLQRINFPAPKHRCKVERVVGEHIYHEHFASNENTKCLAWIECREDKTLP